ncbi:hypothetical protein C1N81_05000 (plasmid) [Streptomyces sp. SGAir0957]
MVGIPRGWSAKGLATDTAAAVALIGAPLAGRWGGLRGLVTGEVGVLAVAALVLIALVAAVGACLVLAATDVAAGVRLPQRGLVESARVASIEATPGRRRAVCSLTEVEAALAGVQVWRGCAASTLPGPTLPVVYDPRGRAPARLVAAPDEPRTAELRLAALAFVFVGGCALAVVRSFRLRTTPSNLRRNGAMRASSRTVPEDRPDRTSSPGADQAGGGCLARKNERARGETVLPLKVEWLAHTTGGRPALCRRGYETSGSGAWLGSGECRARSAP